MELGCGTGRNTVKLLTLPPALNIKEINALDLSPGMLEVAKQRCENYLVATAANTLSVPPAIAFHEFDALHPELFPEVKQLEGKADLVFSTLVLEHLPLDIFFRIVKNLLKPGGGYVVVTNMHAEMGRLSQAGFLDPSTGEKVRGHSYSHEISEVIEEGEKFGFSVVGEVGERGVEEGDLGTVVGERGRKWVGIRVWFGFVMKFGGVRER
jgi:SAM-dependent methyltransferase